MFLAGVRDQERAWTEQQRHPPPIEQRHVGRERKHRRGKSTNGAQPDFGDAQYLFRRYEPVERSDCLQHVVRATDRPEEHLR
jgi:hypothetical protein